MYNDDWCRYPSGLVHEIGHNLGLNHAGEGSVEYADQTGFMGYSYAEFNMKMCYNPAKSWQLGWYSQRREMLEFNKRGGFSGSLVGITDYQHEQASDKLVHLKIPGESQVLYVGYNRNTGINANTQEGWNQVTVQAQTNDGISNLLVKLNSGGEYVVSKFMNKKNLIIKVNTINTSASPAYADVIVYMDGCPPGQCGTACYTPCVTTPAPVPPAPTVSPITPTTSPVTSSSTILSESFDGGLGTLKSNNGKITNKVVNSAIGSTKSLELKSFGSQVYTNGAVSVGQHQLIQIKVWVYASQGVNGDKLLLELSTDNGTTWQVVQTFSRETNFPVDKRWYELSVDWTRSSGVQSISLRVTTATSASSSKGKVYLENLIMVGQ